MSCFILGFILFVDDMNITKWLSSANVSEDRDHSGLSITKEQVNSVSVTFKSGENRFCI